MKIPHTLSEFEQTYYYKTELVKLCRQLKLPTSGTKAELNSYIRECLNGTPATQIKPLRSKKSHCPLPMKKLILIPSCLILDLVLIRKHVNGLQIILVLKDFHLVSKWLLSKEKPK